MLSSPYCCSYLLEDNFGWSQFPQHREFGNNKRDIKQEKPYLANRSKIDHVQRFVLTLCSNLSFRGKKNLPTGQVKLNSTELHSSFRCYTPKWRAQRDSCDSSFFCTRKFRDVSTKKITEGRFERKGRKVWWDIKLCRTRRRRESCRTNVTGEIFLVETSLRLKREIACITRVFGRYSQMLKCLLLNPKNKRDVPFETDLTFTFQECLFRKIST